MPRTCSICSHVNRNEIETMLSSGKPFRNVAEQYQVSASAIFRHKNHTKAILPIAPLALVENSTEIDVTPENLTGKEISFIDAYFGAARFNGTEAARVARYSGNDNVLAVTASRLLRNPKIVAAVALRFKAMHISADEVIAEISKVARADWGEFVEVKTKNGETVSVQMSLRDKLKALEMAGKNLGILADVIIQERIVVFALSVYQRIADELPGIEDGELRGWLGPILEIEPDQLTGKVRVAG